MIMKDILRKWPGNRTDGRMTDEANEAMTWADQWPVWPDTENDWRANRREMMTNDESAKAKQ